MIFRSGWRSNTPAQINRSRCVPVSTGQPQVGNSAESNGT
jgi:hypothetical protein